MSIRPVGCNKSILYLFIYLRLFSVPHIPLNVRHQRTFPDSRFSASSYLNESNSPGRPEHATLNNKQGSWCPLYTQADEWLELDLGSDQTIYGVAVQGSHDSASKVTKYNISLRTNGASEGTWVVETVGI